MSWRKSDQKRILLLFENCVKWLRVNFDLICPEDKVIIGESRFHYVLKVKWLRVNLHLICPEGSVIKGETNFYSFLK